MNHGFVKVAAVTPLIKVADPVFNTEMICKDIKEAANKGAKIIVFPELAITGYTCGDLFLQETLLEGAIKGLRKILTVSEDIDALIFVGLPVEVRGKLYNMAAAIHRGKLLGLVPKQNIPNYAEFYEGRYFAKGEGNLALHKIEGIKSPLGEEIYVGNKIIFQAHEMPGLMVCCEICEDMWVGASPAIGHTQAGATVVVNLSSSDETVGKAEYREMIMNSTSARLVAAYIYSGSGEGESTQDMVFCSHNMISENGVMLRQNKTFAHQMIFTDIDIQKILMERRRMNSFQIQDIDEYVICPFSIIKEKTELERTFATMPFVPTDISTRRKRCNEILDIQSYGLKKRLEHTACKTAVVGISGGLDSTLALIVTARAFDLLNIPRKNIYAITMPCFGTTDRTYQNACKMAEILEVTLKEVDIKESVTLHFRDIEQSMENHNVTYENAQARERTQVLMDIANRENGMVIGTGDMSELALGWATYNGDHMSMYGVNGGVPKTLVRHLVHFYADNCHNEALKNILLDVLDTPVSPELLPPVEGEIAQKTEDLVGPYELHDFFLYYVVRCAFSPSKIYRIACQAFGGEYQSATILKWLKTFYRRFFTQQFKRSCLPDGPKVGSVALSPRGDLRMPSDASMNLWMQELESIDEKL